MLGEGAAVNQLAKWLIALKWRLTAQRVAAHRPCPDRPFVVQE